MFAGWDSYDAVLAYVFAEWGLYRTALAQHIITANMRSKFSNRGCVTFSSIVNSTQKHYLKKKGVVVDKACVFLTTTTEQSALQNRTRKYIVSLWNCNPFGDK